MKFSYIIIALIILGCSKKESVKPHVSGLLKLKTTYFHNNGSSSGSLSSECEYGYYPDGRIKYSRIYYSSQSRYSISNWEYNGDTVYTYVESYENGAFIGSSSSEIYQINESDTITFRDLETGNILSIYYYFSTDPCGYKLREIYENNELYNSIYITYNDENCSYWEDELIGGTKGYVLDDKHSWETSITPEYLKKSSFGNILRYSKVNSNEHIDPLVTYYEYEYSSNHYPIKMIATNNYSDHEYKTVFEYY